MRPRAIGGDEVQPAGHDICGFDGVLWLPLRRLFGGRVVAATYVLRRCALGCDRWFPCALRLCDANAICSVVAAEVVL